MSLLTLIIIYGIVAILIVCVIACILLALAINRVNKARARLHEIITEQKMRRKRS